MTSPLGSAKEGMALIRSGARVAHYVLEASRVGETVAKVLRYVKVVSNVLAVVGLIIDAFLLFWEVFEGDTQRKELRKSVTFRL